MPKAKEIEVQGTEKEFLEIFKPLCYSRNYWEVWSDLMTVIACSISNATDRSKEHYEKREKEYMTCIEKLGSVDAAAKIMGIIVMALENNPNQDFLGKMYMNLELGNHWKAQFFTPYCVCRMMAEINIGDWVQKEIDRKGYIAVNDPACGAGATLIAAVNSFRQHNIDFQSRVVFVGQDIDRVVGMMCYIQLSLLGCSGYIAIANTLSNRRLFNRIDKIVGTGTNKKPVEKEHELLTFYLNEQEEAIMSEKKLELSNEKDNTEEAVSAAEGIEESKDKFLSGAEKLAFEEGEILKKVNKGQAASYKTQYDMIFQELIKKCNEESEFNTAVLQEHKTWERCFSFAGKRAMELNNPSQEERNKARNGVAPIVTPVSSEMLFEWIFEYYRRDDKAESEKEAKEVAEKKKIGAKKSTVSKLGVTETKIQKEETKAVKKKNEMDGQFSLFNLM